MLPVGLVVEIDRLRGELGLSRSAVLALAAARFIAENAAVLKPNHRVESLAAVERLFVELVAEAREAA